MRLGAELSALLVAEAQAVLAAVVGQGVDLVVAADAALLLDAHPPQIAQRVADPQHLVELAGEVVVVRVEVVHALLDADVASDYVVKLLLHLVVLGEGEVHQQPALLYPLKQRLLVGAGASLPQQPHQHPLLGLLAPQRNAQLFFAPLVLVLAEAEERVLAIDRRILPPLELVEALNVAVQLVHHHAQRRLHH